MPSRWTIGRCRTKCYSCHAHAAHTNFLCRGSFRCPLHHFRRGRSLRYPVQMALLMDSANKTLDSTRSYKNISYERKCYCGKYTECDWLCWKKVARAAIASFRQIWNMKMDRISLKMLQHVPGKPSKNVAVPHRLPLPRSKRKEPPVSFGYQIMQFLVALVVKLSSGLDEENIIVDLVEKFFVLTARNFGRLCQTKGFLIQLGYVDHATRPSQQMSSNTLPFLQNPR
uniref:Uncharacterized protein LOC108047158 isoform X2 n=1 Tax=Drosophila rhopaloa TaxID=1041015 RepID=A0A6P4EX28_DRORH